MRYLAVPIEVKRWLDGDESFIATLECGCSCQLDYAVCGYGSTEEEAFADLLAKLGYREVKEPTISDKMRDVAQWLDHLYNARHQTDDMSRELYWWADSIDVCSGNKE